MTKEKVLYEDDLFILLGNGTLMYNYKIEPNGIVRGMLVGQIIQEVDGYYHWDMGSMKGLWSSHILRKIADILDALNKEWDDEVRRYFTSDKRDATTME